MHEGTRQGDRSELALTKVYWHGTRFPRIGRLTIVQLGWEIFTQKARTCRVLPWKSELPSTFTVSVDFSQSSGSRTVILPVCRSRDCGVHAWVSCSMGGSGSKSHVQSIPRSDEEGSPRKSMFAMDGFLDKSQPTVFKHAGVDSRFFVIQFPFEFHGKVELNLRLCLAGFTLKNP